MIASSRFAKLGPPSTARSTEGSAVSGQIAGCREVTQNFIRSRPILCLSLAVALGVTLGWLIKQR